MKIKLSLMSRRILGSLLILLCLFIIVLSIILEGKGSKYVTEDNEIKYKQYIFIPYGEKEDTLGHGGSIGSGYGPGSFAVATDGTVYILDTFNRKIKRYTAGGSFMFSSELPGNTNGVDFEVYNNTIYLLGIDGGIYVKNVNGKDWTRKGYSQLRNFTGIYSDSGQAVMRSWNGDGLILSATDGPTYTEKRLPTYINKTNLKSDLLLSCIVRDSKLEDYVLVQEILKQNKSYAELRIVKYSDNEIKETALAAPLSYYIYSNPFKKLYLSRTGEVYQMVPLENGIAIFYIPWFNGEKTRITPAMLEENEGTLS